MLSVSPFAALAAALALAPLAGARTEGGVIYAYVSLEQRNELAIVEPETGAVRDRIPVPRGPHNVASTGSRAPVRVAVTSPPAGAVTLLEIFRRNVRVLRGFASPHDVEFSPDGRWAYVTEEHGGRVAVVSATRRRVVARVPTGPGPHDLAVSPDGGRVWVTHGPSARAITILDTSRPSRPRAIGHVAAPDAHDVAFSPDGRSVWITYWNSNVVAELSAPSGSVAARVRVGKLVHHVAVDQARIWVTDHGGGAAFVLDRRGRTLRSVGTGQAPHHVALLLGRAVVVADDGTVSSFDARSGGPRYQTVRLRTRLHGVALVWGP